MRASAWRLRTAEVDVSAAAEVADADPPPPGPDASAEGPFFPTGEDLGYHTAWFGDHVIVPGYAAHLSPPNWYDALATCLVGAGMTTRLRFSPDVLVLPYRNPVELASIVATADQLSGWAWLSDMAVHCILPVVCLTYAGLAYISRQMRAGMLGEIRQDYIRTAEAKGAGRARVIFVHALRNGLFPIITLFASLLPFLIGGSVIIETE